MFKAYRSVYIGLIILGFILIASCQFNTQTDDKKPTGSDINTDTYSGKIEGSFLEKNLQWREIGPVRGGRSCTVVGLENEPLTYFTGYTGAGVWKTTDAGINWKNISDGYFGGSIGAVAVYQKNPNIIYVGEGEKTIRGDVSTGRGLWKSIDGGHTWKHIGLDDSKLIGRIRIHPNNPNIVYVAVIGNLWKASEDRGVYKTIDGGKTWNKILYANEQAGAIDLILDPSNPETIYTTTYRVKRNGYRLDSGGEGSHLWKSTNGGLTWDILSDNPGMPKGVLGNIGVAVSPVNPNRVWAVVESKQGGLYRSDDAGKTWIHASDYVELYQKAYYYMRVYADPKNQDKVYVLSTRFHTSTDGGLTFKSERGAHVDYHDMWINPKNPNHVALASDGGVRISLNGAKSWSSLYNQPTAQIYRVSADNAYPFNIYGGQQDWGTVRMSHLSNPFDFEDGSKNQSWEATAGGESGYVVADPTNPNIVYAGTYKGYMMRKDHATNQTRSVNIWPKNPAGWGVEVMKYRFNWNFPVFFSPHENDKLYAASNFLHASTNEGQSWDVISPDLTRNEPETLKSSGGPISQDNTGVEFYGTIITAVESPYEKGLLWTGSDDGLIQVSRNGGKQWDNVTPEGLPNHAMVNDISVNPFVNGGAYMAATAYKFGDYTPYLYKTLDYGKTWKLITSGIPNEEFTRCIEADTNRKGLLYTGTEWGLFVSFDDGVSWKSMSLNLPIVSIRDLLVKDSKLIAATHGRGFWIIDDLAVLHQMTDAISEKQSYLFKPNRAYRPGKVNFSFFSNNGIDATLEILSNKDESIVSFDIEKLKGSKLMSWDMSYPGFKPFEGMHFYSSPNRGPKAVPGIYKARFISGKDTIIQPFEILKDPRLTVTQTELEQQFAFLMTVRESVSKANNTLTEIRVLRATITDENSGNAKQLKELENQLQDERIVGGRDPLKYGVRLNNRLAFLLTDQQRGDFPPTVQAEEVFTELNSELETIINQLETIKKELQ